MARLNLWSSIIIGLAVCSICQLTRRVSGGNTLMLSSCNSDSSLFSGSCSPSWCTYNSAIGCLFDNYTVDYAAQLSSMSCKVCTQSTASQCSTLSSVLKGTHVKAAYCNDAYLVIHSDGLPNHQAYIQGIPQPPGAGGEGANTGIYQQCVTRSMTPQWQSYKVPLSVSLLAESGNNNASFPTGTLLSVAELPGAGAMGVAINGMPIFPGPDNHNAWFWENCEADLCNAHVGKGGDYHYHGDPYSCLYTDSDYQNNHPPMWGWASDGVKIYGRHTATSQDGWDQSLDRCGGHSHGSYGYHYHSYVKAGTAAIPWGGSGNMGKYYVAYLPGPGYCWRGDISKVPNFWMGNQVAYDNSKTNPVNTISARPDYEQLRPCCGSTNVYTAAGVTLNLGSSGGSTASPPPPTGARKPPPRSTRKPPPSTSNPTAATKPPPAGSSKQPPAGGVRPPAPANNGNPPAGGDTTPPPSGGGSGGSVTPKQEACFFLPNTTASEATGMPCSNACSNGGPSGKPGAVAFPTGTTWTMMTWTTAAAAAADFPTFSTASAWSSFASSHSFSAYYLIAFKGTLPTSSSVLAAAGVKLPASSPIVYTTATAGGKCEGRYEDWQEVVYPSGTVWKICAAPVNSSISPPPPTSTSPAQSPPTSGAQPPLASTTPPTGAVRPPAPVQPGNTPPGGGGAGGPARPPVAPAQGPGPNNGNGPTRPPAGPNGGGPGGRPIAPAAPRRRN